MSPRSPKRLLVVYNPVAGRRHRARFAAILDRLAAAGASMDIRETLGPGDAEAIARREAHAPYDAVAVAGGDGTVNEVVNGLGPDAPPIAVIPLGTANVLASEIGLSTRAASVVAAILDGEPRRVRIGRVNGRRFLLMAGAGLDGEVVANLAPRLKRCLGKAAYVAQTLRELMRYRFPELKVVIDGKSYRAATAVVAKARRYGGPHLFAPGAGLDTLDFEVVLFEKGGALSTVACGLALVLGLITRMPGVSHRRGVSIEIRSRAAVAVQADGDRAGRLPAAITIDPEPVRVLYPVAGRPA